MRCRLADIQDAILKASFIDRVVNTPKAEDCQKDMVKAGFTRSVAAIMTRSVKDLHKKLTFSARDKIKKGLM